MQHYTSEIFASFVDSYNAIKDKIKKTAKGGRIVSEVLLAYILSSNTLSCFAFIPCFLNKATFSFPLNHTQAYICNSDITLFVR